MATTKHCACGKPASYWLIFDAYLCDYCAANAYGEEMATIRREAGLSPLPPLALVTVEEEDA